jgi:hypothetical protein
MVRHSVFTSMFKIIITLLTALFIVGVGAATVPAAAHDCSCEQSNSGPGSTDSGSDNSGSGSSGSGSSGVDNRGPGNACHDNSGPGSTGPDNSGPGNAHGDDCPAEDPGGDSGDSTDPGNGPSTSNGGGSGNSASPTGAVVVGAESSAPTQAGGAAVPSSVNAGLISGEGLTASDESPRALPGLAILLGVAMMFLALRRRTGV